MLRALDRIDAKAGLLKCLDGILLAEAARGYADRMSRSKPDTAAVGSRAARSAGPTVRSPTTLGGRASATSYSRAFLMIRPPKIQLPKSSSQGVIRSTRVP